uniref:PUM-HD domain-containing protein n=1 Tax=Ciona savignyi TaxID=51511 RepID=H2YBU2_CIOSA
MSEMGSVVSGGKYGVLIKVAERCCQHSQYQSQFVKALLKTLHCETDERKIFLVPLVVGFLTFEKYFPTSTIDLNKIPLLRNITYHGSLLLQILLKFEKKFVVVKSFLEIPSQHFVALACNASGSHLVDILFSSEKVRLKRKNSLVEKVKSDLHKLACDKYGSRVLENIWRQSSLKIKVAIAESLAPHDLTNNQWGKHVHRNFALKLFTERNSTWLEQQERFDNKRKLFKQFMPDQPVQKKKKTS